MRRPALVAASVLCAATAWAQADRGQRPRQRSGPCGSSDPAYGRLANATGGQQYWLRPGEVEKSSAVMGSQLSHPVDVYFAYGVLQRGRPRNFQVVLDSTIESVAFSATVQCKESITIWRPSGEAVPSGGAPGFEDTEMASGRILTVSRPEAGAWQVRVAGSGQASLSVRAKTELDFSRFEFVRLVGRPGHEGLFPIEGQPTGAAQTALARVSGPFRSASFLLVSDTGETLQRLELAPTGEREEFVGPVRLPARPFRAMVQGYDEKGYPYQRIQTRLFQLQAIEIAALNRVESLKPGTTTRFSFRVRNLAAAGPIEVRVVWVGRNFIRTPPPTRVTLASGGEAAIDADVDIPADAIPHTEISVTATARRLTPTAAENGAVLRLSVR